MLCNFHRGSLLPVLNKSGAPEPCAPRAKMPALGFALHTLHTHSHTCTHVKSAKIARPAKFKFTAESTYSKQANLPRALLRLFRAWGLSRERCTIFVTGGHFLTTRPQTKRTGCERMPHALFASLSAKSVGRYGRAVRLYCLILGSRPRTGSSANANVNAATMAKRCCCSSSTSSRLGCSCNCWRRSGAVVQPLGFWL